MRKENLGLITIFHPEKLLGNINLWPYIVRSREKTENWHYSLAKKNEMKITSGYRNAKRIDMGTQVIELLNKSIHGTVFAPTLADFRLIFTPDEKPPKAKWKLENRKNWTTNDGLLNMEQNDQIIQLCLDYLFCINGFWINASQDIQKWGYPTWVNLVLVPLDRKKHHKDDKKIKIYSENGRLWIEWKDQENLKSR